MGTDIETRYTAARRLLSMAVWDAISTTLDAEIDRMIDEEIEVMAKEGGGDDVAQ